MLGTLSAVICLGQALKGDPLIAVAKQYFAEAAVAAESDHGKLWGGVLTSPLLLVDSDTRKIYASQADAQGLLQLEEGVWTGKLPDALPVANYAFKWSGVRWTIIALSTVPASLDERIELFMHETFHWFQPDLGLLVAGRPCAHMDTYDGRVWIRLEGKAMQQALLSEGDVRLRHLKGALTFRAYRQSKFPDAAEDERLLELNEGLAQYTGISLMGMPRDETFHFAARVLGGWPSSRPSLSRWYAYDLLPAYGLTLDELDAVWRSGLTKDSDVVGVLAAKIGWTAPRDLARGAAVFARPYGLAKISSEERERDKAHKKVIAELEKKFVKGTVIVVPLSARRPFAFRTDSIVELPPYGTVFSNVQLQDEWGSVSVDQGGILLSPDRSVGYLSSEGSAGVKGDGWRLELNSGWGLAPGKRQGDLEIVRSLPMLGFTAAWHF